VKLTWIQYLGNELAWGFTQWRSKENGRKRVFITIVGVLLDPLIPMKVRKWFFYFGSK